MKNRSGVRATVVALVLLGAATGACDLLPFMKAPAPAGSPAESSATVEQSAPPPSIVIPRESVTGPGPSPTPEVPPPMN
jgi:hypothetical protein